MPWKYTLFFLMVTLSEKKKHKKNPHFFPQPIHEYIKFQVMFFSLKPALNIFIPLNTPYCWTSYVHHNTCHLLIDSLRLLQIILCIRSLSTKKTVIFLNTENITSPLKSPTGLKAQHILQIPYPFKLLAYLSFPSSLKLAPLFLFIQYYGVPVSLITNGLSAGAMELKHHALGFHCFLKKEAYKLLKCNVMYAKLKLSTGSLWYKNAYLFQAGRI